MTYKITMKECKNCHRMTYVGENGHDPNNVICDACRLATERFRETLLHQTRFCLYCGLELEGKPLGIGRTESRLSEEIRVKYGPLPLTAHIECVVERWKKKYISKDRYYSPRGHFYLERFLSEQYFVVWAKDSEKWKELIYPPEIVREVFPIIDEVDPDETKGSGRPSSI